MQLTYCLFNHACENTTSPIPVRQEAMNQLPILTSAFVPALLAACGPLQSGFCASTKTTQLLQDEARVKTAAPPAEQTANQRLAGELGDDGSCWIAEVAQTQDKQY